MDQARLDYLANALAIQHAPLSNPGKVLEPVIGLTSLDLVELIRHAGVALRHLVHEWEVDVGLAEDGLAPAEPAASEPVTQAPVAAEPAAPTSSPDSSPGDRLINLAARPVPSR